MCDDDNRWPADNDVWKLVGSKSPNKQAKLAMVPLLLPDHRSTIAALGILDGTMRYDWAIYECKDYTGINSAGFFVYKSHSRFVEDQRFWSMWEEDRVLADTPKRFMYACDSANCEQNFEPVTRQEALMAAELYANTWPTYDTPDGFATLRLSSETLEFEGTYEVSSDMANLMPTHKFTGCTSAPRICVTATAQPSILGI